METPPSQLPGSFIFTGKQRLGATLLGAAILALLVGRWALNRQYITDPQPARGVLADELSGRIDPNTADWQTLAALPVIGPSLARKIVADREAFAAGHPEEVPYFALDDMRRVKGIGPATLENLVAVP